MKPNTVPQNSEKKHRAGRILCEVLLSLGLIGGSLFAWLRLRPHLLHEVFSVETPLPTTQDDSINPNPVEVKAFSESIPFVPEGTPAPSPTASPTPVPTPSPVPTKNPANGDTLLAGDEQPIVLDIAIRLMELEYLDFDQPTEEYTEGTADAVRDFQLRNGLEVSGACDPQTYEKLFSADALHYAIVRGATGELVALVKERLVELGYLPEDDTSDIYGEATEEAVRLFRSRNRLKEDVIVDTEAFERLFDPDTVGYFFAIGDKNDQILHFQQRLLEQGYLSGLPDGVFGKLTQVAVSRFQEENGLVADGNLARSTMTLLDSGEGVRFTFQNGAEGEDVRHLQNRLVRLGYLTEKQATGYFGDKTESAIKAFQKRNGLKQSGAADTQTIALLHSKDAKANPTPKPTAKPTPKTTKAPRSTPKPGAATPKPTAEDSGDLGSGGSTIQYGEGIEAFIGYAESKIGCKYVRGGKGPNKFDCSGFVYWCLNQAGVKQGYMTSIGWRSCKKYRRLGSMSELKRGDVIVFSGSSSSKGHVGIYLGNGKMIDASSGAGAVRITSNIQRSSYWTEHFLMAYRIWD